MSQNRSFKSAS